MLEERTVGLDDERLVRIDALNHSFGEGELCRQVLFDVSAEIRAGEIVILVGPSGCGKTTLLTLIGALRSVQDGSVRVLGQELNGAEESDLVDVRRRIGYVFQAHNLLDSLSAAQNVQMALNVAERCSHGEAHRRCLDALEQVGLSDRAAYTADQLSGGQKQRVAIARALVNRPRIVLADEPTASLDRQSGRDVVELMQRLAKQQGSTVFLVTHDNRILDVADRILHLEDGRLVSFAHAVAANTEHMFSMLAQDTDKGEFLHYVKQLPLNEFANLLDRVTEDFQHLVQVTEVANTTAFESMLDQVLQAFTFKVGEILGAERATLFLVDEDRNELWSKVAQSEGQKPLRLRFPRGVGIAGQVASTGKARNIPDVYAEPLFNREIDQKTGYRTRNMLCVPIKNSQDRVFAVAQLLNKRGEQPFGKDDELRFEEFAAALGVILESWWRMTRVVLHPAENSGGSA
jgi:putative ABC transport system ATP-binding protein